MRGETCNILFCGVGGQGVLTAAEICGVAAMLSGYHVRKSEVHGMAQRGGSVESHVRFGRQVFSPLIREGEADFLVCFNAGEDARLNSYLGKNGVSFVEFLRKAAGEVEDKRYVNTFLLGVLSNMLPVKRDSWICALETVLRRAVDENKKAFLLGAETAEKGGKAACRACGSTDGQECGLRYPASHS